MKTIYLGLILVLMANVLHAQVISAGYYHSLVICEDSTVRSFGRNNWAQLGDGSYTDSNIPVQASSLTKVIAVGAGWYHSVALKDDGTVWTWGQNLKGQLGDGTNSTSQVPKQVMSLSGITSIGTGAYHSFAIKDDGTIWAWGHNYYGQLGSGATGDTNLPVQVLNLSGVVTITGGWNHSIALKDDGTVWTWGYNQVGQLGHGNNLDTILPTRVDTLAGIKAIASGQQHCLAIASDSTVFSWGNNGDGQLGVGTTSWSNVPLPVDSLTGIVAIGLGNMANHSLALNDEGQLWTWGNNTYGQHGDGGNIEKHSPEMLGSFTGITEISTGNVHTMVIRDDTTTWSWGWNSFGQLGIGNNTDTNVPVEITALCKPIMNCNTTTGTHAVSSCSTYTWIDGNSYTTSNNTATYLLTGAAGCDSLVTLDLTITAVDVGVASNDTSITANSTGAVYQWLDCSNSYALMNGETTQSFITFIGGDYAVEISATGCTDTSTCTTLLPFTSLARNGVLDKKGVYPNPSKGTVNIVLGTMTDATITIKNLHGQEVYHKARINEHVHQIELNTQNGLYFIEITAKEGKFVQKLVIYNDLQQ